MRLSVACALWKLCHGLHVAKPWGAREAPITQEDRDLLCNASAHPFPDHMGLKIRWLHVPNSGSDFVTSVFHYGCPNMNPNLTLGHGFPTSGRCKFLSDESPELHVPIGKNEWVRHSKKFVTMLRHPKSRNCAAFRRNRACHLDCNPENGQGCFQARGPGKRCPGLRAALSLEEYSRGLGGSGCVARMLSGRPCNEPRQLSAHEQAVALRRLQSFAFVGLYEEWRLSICVFHRLLGGAPLPIEFEQYIDDESDCPEKRRWRGKRTEDADDAVYVLAKRRFWMQAYLALRELRGAD